MRVVSRSGTTRRVASRVRGKRKSEVVAFVLIPSDFVPLLRVPAREFNTVKIKGALPRFPRFPGYPDSLNFVG